MTAPEIMHAGEGIDAEEHRAFLAQLAEEERQQLRASARKKLTEKEAQACNL